MEDCRNIDLTALDMIANMGRARQFFATSESIEGNVEFSHLVEREEDAELFDRLPAVTPEEMEKINDLFTPYVFYQRKKDGDMVCTCTKCHATYVIPRLRRTDDATMQEFYASRHNDVRQCRACGAIVTMKSIPKAKSRDSLWESQNVVLFRREGDQGALALALWCAKNYGNSIDPPPLLYERYVYWFAPDGCFQWKRNYKYDGGCDGRGSWPNVWKRQKTISEPWPKPSWSNPNSNWWQIGLGCLKNTYLRYANLKTWRDDLMHYIAAYTRRPQIEMLEKLGLTSMVKDMVFQQHKLTDIVNWSGKKPQEAFGLSAPEYKLWHDETKGDPDILRNYKRLRKKVPSVTLEDILEMKKSLNMTDYENLLHICRFLCISPERAGNYLRRQRKGKAGGENAILTWRDYLDMAQSVKYDLTEHLVMMPRDLMAAHDSVMDVCAQIQAEQEAKENTALTERLRKKYGFEMDGFVIRPPVNSREIINEGKSLHHCVGSYAPRHFKGQTVILFMRESSKPLHSVWTIEMNGVTMQQVQGYADASTNKPHGKAKEFLDKWLTWVEAGSKRDKDGNPVIFEKEEVVA